MTKNASLNTPIIIGVGQVAEPSNPLGKHFSSANDLAAEAARRAIANACSATPLAPHIDALTAIRLFEDSTSKIAMVNNPLGSSNNVPGSIAKRLNISPRELIYAAVGGQSPQRMVNEFCERIFRGENQCALITGAEAIANIKYAVRHGIEADWHETIDKAFEDRWQKDKADSLVSEYEMAHGLFLPVQTYPLFENFYRHKLGHNTARHREGMAQLFAPFTKIAAKNQYAQFPTELSAEFLATPSAANYLLSEPYLKWFVAQDAVNQGAAVLLTSVGLARELGVPEEKWVYLHGYADVDDVNVVDRKDLSLSHAQKLTCSHALSAAGKVIDEIDHLDIYSCFPIAVTSACSALGIDPLSRALTLTGGLPFFGGPGNNYSMHAIAELVETLRRSPNSSGMIIANGGYLSKHSAGIYSTSAIEAWKPIDSSPVQGEMSDFPKTTVIEQAEGSGAIESYVAAYQRGAAEVGYIFGRTADKAERFIAKVSQKDESTLQQLFAADPMGAPIMVHNNDGINYFRFES